MKEKKVRKKERKKKLYSFTTNYLLLREPNPPRMLYYNRYIIGFYCSDNHDIYVMATDILSKHNMLYYNPDASLTEHHQLTGKDFIDNNIMHAVSMYYFPQKVH